MSKNQQMIGACYYWIRRYTARATHYDYRASKATSKEQRGAFVRERNRAAGRVEFWRNRLDDLTLTK